MRLPNLALFSAFFVAGLVLGDATRTKDKIYDAIEGTTACFRRLNGTHQFGCGSKWEGSVGVLQELKDPVDVEWLTKEAPDGQYMAVVGLDMFTRTTMDTLKASNRVSGMVLLQSKDKPRSFTPEDTCPNRYSGLSSFSSQQCSDANPWNPKGSSLLLVDWGFPIFHVHNETSIEMIRNCTRTFNSEKEGMTSRSLCAIEMKAFMIAAKDSETCIRRSNLNNNLKPQKYCDPMGDRNVWATLFPRDRSQPEEDGSVILLTARFDTTSMFDGEAPGAVSAVTGLVTALATYHLLSEMKPEQNKRNVMLVLFNGESYDYIGSSRLVYDMAKEMFPPKGSGTQPFVSSKIKLVVELNQLSQFNKSGGLVPMYFHKTISNNAEIEKFVELMRTYSTGALFTDSTSKILPPISLQSFVKADAKVPGVAITDYDQYFTNNYFHSILDDAELIDYKFANGTVIPDDAIQSYLAKLSTTLARTIYNMLTNTAYTGTLRTESSTIDELLYCYLNSTNCKLFRQAISSDYKLPEYPPALYVGVTNGLNAVTSLTGNLIALFTGTKVDLPKEECKSNKTDLTYQYVWMVGKNEDGSNASICMQTTMNYTVASSPAFEIEDYDWKSGNYSTWTESVWTTFEVRMFLKPSFGHEAFIISFGSVFLFLSIFVVFFIYKQSDVFFSGNALGGC